MRFLMWASVTAVALITSALLADLPGRKGPPGPPPTFPPFNAARIRIEVGEAGIQPRLVIPRPLLNKVRTGAGVREQLTNGFIPPQLEHLLLALALAAGGLGLLRGRTRIAFATVFLLTLGGMLAANRDTFANAPPPHPVIPRIQVGEILLENVRIELTPEQGELRLALPSSALPHVR